MRDYSAEGIDPFTPEEEAEAWAETVGRVDGFAGGVGEEGRAALAGEWYERRAYIREYHEGFMARKLEAGEITEDEYLFFDPYPGRWGAYWEVLA